MRNSIPTRREIKNILTHESRKLNEPISIWHHVFSCLILMFVWHLISCFERHSIGWVITNSVRTTHIIQNKEKKHSEKRILTIVAKDSLQKTDNTTITSYSCRNSQLRFLCLFCCLFFKLKANENVRALVHSIHLDCWMFSIYIY